VQPFDQIEGWDSSQVPSCQSGDHRRPKRPRRNAPSVAEDVVDATGGSGAEEVGDGTPAPEVAADSSADAAAAEEDIVADEGGDVVAAEGIPTAAREALRSVFSPLLPTTI